MDKPKKVCLLTTSIDQDMRLLLERLPDPIQSWYADKPRRRKRGGGGMDFDRLGRRR